MLEIHSHAAPLAFTARALGPGFGTKQELTEPESESLLPHASRAVDEQARRKRSHCQRARKGRLKVRVTENGVQAHRPCARSHLSGSSASGSPLALERTWNSRWGPSGVSAPPTVPITWPATTSRPWATSISSR